MADEVRFSPYSFGAKADEDMVNASAVITAHIGIPSGGMFWCHQAVERYLKYCLGQTKPTFKLGCRHELLSLACEIGFSTSREERVLLAKLTRAYYEHDPGDPDETPQAPLTWEDAESALAFAQKVQKWTYAMHERIKDRLKDSKTA